MPQHQTQPKTHEISGATPAAIPAVPDEQHVQRRLADLRRRYQRHIAAWASDVLALRRAATVVGVGTSDGGDGDFWLNTPAPSDHGMAA